MPRIELSYLLRPTTTPEQEILLTDFYARFDKFQAGGGNRRISNVEPLVFIGDSPATEFLVYSATKLYLCYKLVGGSTGGAIDVTAPSIYLYDESNTVAMVIGQISTYYNTTIPEAKYMPSLTEINNIYFSRLQFNSYYRLYFIGYRITLQ